MQCPSTLVPIEEITIDLRGHLLIRPKLAPSEDLSFIWRDATGIRWNEEHRCLCAAEPDRWTHGPLYRQILAAALGEYGICLALTGSTVWTNVAADVRQAIETGR